MRRGSSPVEVFAHLAQGGVDVPDGRRVSPGLGSLPVRYLDYDRVEVWVDGVIDHRAMRPGPGVSRRRRLRPLRRVRRHRGPPHEWRRRGLACAYCAQSGRGDMAGPEMSRHGLATSRPRQQVQPPLFQFFGRNFRTPKMRRSPMASARAAIGASSPTHPCPSLQT